MPATSLKRDSDTDVLHWILRNFYEHYENCDQFCERFSLKQIKRDDWIQNKNLFFSKKTHDLLRSTIARSESESYCACVHVALPQRSGKRWAPTQYFTIVTRNNIVWELARGYCLCYYKKFSLVPDSTQWTKSFATEKYSTLFVPLKIIGQKIKNYRSKENHR